jgi:hypothetical protein
VYSECGQDGAEAWLNNYAVGPGYQMLIIDRLFAKSITVFNDNILMRV